MTDTFLETAIFAGGCFWCTHAEYSGLDGVVDVTSGYTGGQVPNPSYEQVCGGQSGHTEGVLIRFDSTRVSYEKLLDIYWHSIDPTDAGGQFYDRGSQYRTAIFYTTEAQRLAAEQSKLAMLNALKRPIVTEILPAEAFYAAEEYHQDYHRKNPLRYQAYKHGSGRGHKLKQLWAS